MVIRFQNVTNRSGTAFTEGTFGAAWGDYNDDDLPDLWVNNHFSNKGILYKNQGNGTFANVTNEVFLPEELWGDEHGAAWADFDNDGDQDLVQLAGGDGGNANLRLVAV